VIGDILQPTHLLFILVVALLVLGPKRLPEVGRALGRGLRDFRNALSTDELHEQMTSSTSHQTSTLATQEPTEVDTAVTRLPETPGAQETGSPSPAAPTSPSEVPPDPGAAVPAPGPASAVPTSDRTP